MNALKMKLAFSVALSFALSCSIANATTMKTSFRMKRPHPTTHAQPILLQHIKMEHQGWLVDKGKGPSEPTLSTAGRGGKKGK
jgi:hypothetical protein